MNISITTDVAITHILSRKRQTFIASMGVTLGIALYIFSNSLMEGFAKYSREQMFKTIPHIRIFKEEKISKPLFSSSDSNRLVVVVNPKLVATSPRMVNPEKIIDDLKNRPYILQAAPQVNVDIFYNNGQSQLKGVASGVRIMESDEMFNIGSTLEAGSLLPLINDLNSIIIGSGVAAKLNLSLGQHVTVSSSRGVFRTFRVAGIFSVGNSATDDSKSYIHLSAAQQLLREQKDFVTDIYASIGNPDSAMIYAKLLQPSISYKVEDWQTSNKDTLATDGIRKIMNAVVGIAIMMIAAFGIYNILNMTITQKLNDIAILKATGFSGRDVILIFVKEAFIMGFIGTAMGLSLAAILIQIASGIDAGPPIGYFPISFEPSFFLIGCLFGMMASMGAGYFPARKASQVDPVSILRK